ncbi:PilZ domain-containing protein [Vibrio sp. SCSIO 43136]|uniref:PilZ domain-containing protein n=1 Tax=Vibrio sp. SCSIO 43136 TaxID=2819101 RepID=UPI00207558B4|nr:PilZ domain-containing protein [Vibrio sp. SCSIO 43136]USD66940.1 flagellar brake protein [Vibrio sp. SCSIO 43136]
MSTSTAIRPKLTTSSSVEVKAVEAAHLISNTCIANMTIAPPVGSQITVKCSTIGFHSERTLLVEVPQLKTSDIKHHLREGFWVKMKIFTGRGNGTVLQFRCQVSHVIFEPLPMVALTLPTTMQRYDIRVAPRFETSLSLSIELLKKRYDARMLNLSKYGCLLEVSLISKPAIEGQSISIDIHQLDPRLSLEPPLQAIVRNRRKTLSGYQYGVEYALACQAQGERLLAMMTFDGCTMSLV